MPDRNQEKQPLLRRFGKGLVAAGITAGYITGIVLAAPITLGVTAGLGALRGLATREKNQGYLNAIGKGAVQGMLAPFGASATLASDAIKAKSTDFYDLLLDSGRKMPELPGFGKSLDGQKQPLWKRIGKIFAGAALLGGTITACVVVGPAVATGLAVAAAYGAYKGYKEAKASGKSGIWGAIKRAINQVISPITTSALLIAHGVQGCETKSTKVDIFKGLKEQFAPNAPKQATREVFKDLEENMENKQKPALPKRPKEKQRAIARANKHIIGFNDKHREAIRAGLENPSPLLPFKTIRHAAPKKPLPPLPNKHRNKGAAR